jgi:hypothetical protein
LLLVGHANNAIGDPTEKLVREVEDFGGVVTDWLALESGEHFIFYRPVQGPRRATQTGL